jgi:hypothetical protein
MACSCGQRARGAVKKSGSFLSQGRSVVEKERSFFVPEHASGAQEAGAALIFHGFLPSVRWVYAFLTFYSPIVYGSRTLHAEG